MWTLPMPDCETVEDELKTGLTYANGSFRYAYSDDELQELLAVYERYDEQGGQAGPELPATLRASFLNAIKRAYKDTYEGKRLSGLRSRLMLAARKCPYCGFGEVSELDHFLPQSTYHALAIYPRNLIPCCHVCNHKKDTRAAREPENQFPHVYLEKWPDGKFLFADIDVSPDGLSATFRIEQCDAMSDEVYSRARFQFVRLGLDKRYQGEVTQFMTSQRGGVEELGKAGPDPLRAYLEREHSRSRQLHGQNHWRTALCHGLALSDPFIHGGYQYSFG